MTHTAFIGVGANLGDAAAAVAGALDALDALPGTRVAARSSLYRSAPQDYAAQADFVNAAARVDTAAEPGALLASLHRIEDRYGRTRNGPRFGPRTLDLDLLLYDRLEIDTPDLVVPHPRMHRRAFVLAPLAEIAPNLEVPGHGTVRDLLAACVDQAVARLEPVPC